MLIPMADVPRWYADRKPKDAIAISHGEDTLTWEQLERGANRRARAFAAKGVKAGDFVAIGLPNGNSFFETSFAVWKLGATPTSLSWRLPRGEAAAVLDILRPALVVGGEADWNAPNSLPSDFAPQGLSDEPLTSPVARYWKAMTSGGSTGRPKVILDHNPAVVDTSAAPILGMRQGVHLLNPGPLYHNAPFIVSHTALFAGGRLTGMVKFDAEETLRLIAANGIQWVNFVPTMMHRIWSLPEAVRQRYDLSSLEIVFHMAAPMPPWLKEKWIEWLGPERIWELYGGTERQGATVISGVEWLAHKGSRHRRRRQRRRAGRERRNLFLAVGRRRKHLSLSRRDAEAPPRRLGVARRYRPARRRRLSLSRRPARRHDPARRRQHLSGGNRSRRDGASAGALLHRRRPARSRIRPTRPRHPRTRRRGR
jgi:bile acid-coenzyme A ligase